MLPYYNGRIVKATGYPNHLVVRTKLTAARPHKQTLSRRRLTERLLEAVDYRLTVVHAGTGYGKSTALAALDGSPLPVVWYHLDPEDADPFIFLLHLVHGFTGILPGFSETPLALLEELARDGGSEAIWEVVVDRLANEVAEHLPAGEDGTLLLVLDDAHLLRETSATLRVLDRLIGRAPPGLHVIVSTRYPLKLPSLLSWRVRGELLEIGQDELAFTVDETIALFGEQYGYALTPRQADALMEQVEGWPIALPLVWQRLQGREKVSLRKALGQLSGATGDLFAYLAQEVLQQQPDDIRRFLHVTAILRQMTAGVCDCLRQAEDSAEILSYLLDNGLFVVDRGDGHLRYHHLFRELLSRQLPRSEAVAGHRRAATCYRKRGEAEAAIYHYLAAGEEEEAASLLVERGRALVRAGRLDRLAGWIGSLSPDVLRRHSPLLAYLGDVARLRSRFEEALGWYQQAEVRSRTTGDVAGVGQALRGQARVYLDTVNPSKAERLLEEALRLSDGQEDRESRARLLELLAENLLNQGRPAQAQAYQEEARQLREQGVGKGALSLRVLLRTGRLAEARRLLEEQAEVERRKPVQRPRSHRETQLVLALILAFQGERAGAYRCAVEGTARGERLDAPFVSAVGYMRQGHAWLLDKEEASYEEAIACFEEAMAISETIGVPRLKVEASWGLCQAYGFQGGLEMAERVARQGIEIARGAGDEWVEACIRVTLGAGFLLAGEADAAAPWLEQAGAAFRACGDTYGETIVRLWQCLLWHETEDDARLERDVGELLRLVRAHDYVYLFKRRTLMGPPDPRSLVPLLLFARERGRQAAYAGRLLGHLNLAEVVLHPGYRLRVQTLGTFRLWRGEREVAVDEWTRKKARQLFHLLLTYRDTLLEREQITELLWPDLDPEAAERDFKIAYSALNRVLEPGRKPNTPSAYVARDGSRYGLRPEADLWLDVLIFEEEVREGDRLFREDPEAALARYRRGLAVYQGEYLQEYPYAEWASEERERLLTLYLRTAERLAQALVAQEAWEEALAVCRGILARDDCWEEAYRLLMIAYARQGQRSQALRTYRRCVERLKTELGMAPLPGTVALSESLRREQPVSDET